MVIYGNGIFHGQSDMGYEIPYHGWYVHGEMMVYPRASHTWYNNQRIMVGKMLFNYSDNGEINQY